jgi:hypothetical protein
MNFASIDPGADTGIAVFSDTCQLLSIGTIRDAGLLTDYYAKLEATKRNYNIAFALIEAYQPFARRPQASKVQAQIRCCQDVFPLHVMVLTGAWNPAHWKDGYKRKVAAALFNQIFSNSHTTDSALMGGRIFNRINAINGNGFSDLLRLAETTRVLPGREK